MILGPDARVLDVGNVGEYGCGCCGGEERKREQDGVFAPDVAFRLCETEGPFLEGREGASLWELEGLEVVFETWAGGFGEGAEAAGEC